MGTAKGALWPCCAAVDRDVRRGEGGGRLVRVRAKVRVRARAGDRDRVRVRGEGGGCRVREGSAMLRGCNGLPRGRGEHLVGVGVRVRVGVGGPDQK